MIFIVLIALVVLMYFFGLNVLYITGGCIALFYIYAVVSARRSPAQRNNRAEQGVCFPESTPPQ